MRIKSVYVNARELTCGYRAEKVHFSYKPRSERRPERQQYFDKVIVSVWRYGVRNPLITFENHILVGMTRHEVMTKFNPDYVFKCWEIQEDVSQWDRHDIKRLDELKKLYNEIDGFTEVWNEGS